MPCFQRKSSISPFIMKNINPLGMLDEHFLPEKLTKLKGPLVKLEAHIDWMTILGEIVQPFRGKCTTVHRLKWQK